MFGDIIEPINRLSANVSALNNSLYKLEMLLTTLTESIEKNTEEMNATRTANENHHG
jgi:hypothetical protein